MRVIVNGAAGRMGRELVRLLREGYRGATLAAAVDKFANEDGILNSLDAVTETADAIIDFSNHAAAPELAEFVTKRGIAAVIATTGHSDGELAAIRNAALRVPVFMSANMSLGVALLCDLAKRAAAIYPYADIEIIETHHNRKLDAPSGTALMLAKTLSEVRENAAFVYGRGGQHKREKNEIGIHAVRMGNVVGEHEVRIGTDTETITLKHQAHSRALFAEGAVVAAEFLVGQTPGLYSMQDMVK